MEISNHFFSQFGLDVKIKLHAADFMKIWLHYDKDKNGCLEKTELEAFLKDLLKGASNGNEELYKEEMLKKFDANGNGKFEMSEVMKIIPCEENFLEKYKNDFSLSEEEFDRVFQHYDKDKSGFIDNLEMLGFLRDLLMMSNPKVTTKEIEDYNAVCWKFIDTNKDGKISKKELAMILPIKK